MRILFASEGTVYPENFSVESEYFGLFCGRLFIDFLPPKHISATEAQDAKGAKQESN